MKVLDSKKSNKYIVLLFIGMGLILLELFLYKKTLISLSLLWYLIISTGIVATLLDYKRYTGVYKMRTLEKIFIPVIQNICSWGFIVCSVFLMLNYFCADNNVITETLPIVSKAKATESFYRPQSKRINAAFNYNGLTKSLEFPEEAYEKFDQYKVITIKMKKGLFDQYIIVEKSLE